MDSNQYPNGPNGLTNEMNKRMRRSGEDFEKVAREFLGGQRRKAYKLIAMSVLVLSMGAYTTFGELPPQDFDIGGVLSGLLRLLGVVLIGGGSIGLALGVWMRHCLHLPPVREILRDVIAGTYGRATPPNQIDA